MKVAPLSLVHTVRKPTISEAGNARPPLLLLMHGVGSNERSMVSLVDAFDQRAIVVCARSPLMLGPDSFAWFHVTFGGTVPTIVAEEAISGWKHIARFVDELVEAYGADADRVYVGGFSQGGIMALATLLTAPEKIAGAIVMSGRLLPEVKPHVASITRLSGKPVLVIHGLADQKLDIQLARSAREWLQSTSVDLTYRELPIGHAVTRDSVTEASRWFSQQLDGRLPEAG